MDMCMDGIMVETLHLFRLLCLPRTANGTLVNTRVWELGM